MDASATDARTFKVRSGGRKDVQLNSQPRRKLFTSVDLAQRVRDGKLMMNGSKIF
jgi:hypothetical protein